MPASTRSLLISSLSLVLLYWGLYRMPLPYEASAEMNAEQLRQLRDDVAVRRRLGKWQSALKPALKLHAAYPDEPIYMADLGEIYDHLARFGEAAAIWSEYLRHSPTPIEGCPQAGQAFENLASDALSTADRQQLGERAVATFEKCLSFEPDNPDSIFFLAHGLERNGQVDRAGELYRRGMVLSPAYADLRIGLARIQLRQGKAVEARDLATAVLARQPNHVDALLVMGLACRRTGDRENARTYLLRGAGLAPKDSDFQISLAEMSEEDADVRGAIHFYEQAVALDRSNPALAQKLAALRRIGE